MEGGISEPTSEGLLQGALPLCETLSLGTAAGVKALICQGPRCLCHVSSGRGSVRVGSLWDIPTASPP